MDILDQKTLYKEDADNQLMSDESLDSFSEGTNKARRPPNGYILYCLEKRGELRNIHPDLPNIEISKMLGSNWKSLDESERRPYKEKAKARQTEFKKNHPDYKYEKARKKRVTKDLPIAPNTCPNPSAFNSLISSALTGFLNDRRSNTTEATLKDSLALVLKYIPQDFLKQIQNNRLKIPHTQTQTPTPHQQVTLPIIQTPVQEISDNNSMDLMNIPFNFPTNTPSHLDIGLASDPSTLSNDFSYLQADYSPFTD